MFRVLIKEHKGGLVILLRRIFPNILDEHVVMDAH